MIWQDFVIMMVQWGFVLFLIPAALHPTDKPPFISSFLTAIGLYIIAGTMLTLNLQWSALAAAGTGVMWSVLAYQRLRMNRRKKIL